MTMSASMGVKILRSGGRMPVIGLGTYGSFAKEISAAVDCALTVGYRHIDAAALYGNEAAIGDVVDQHLKSGKIKRKDLFVTSKLPPFSFHSPKMMQEQMDKSLDLLKLTYLDMYLMHLPWGMNITEYETKLGEMTVNPDTEILPVWRMIEDFHKNGKAKAIGLSNFSIRLLDKLLPDVKVAPENLQFECHPYYQQRRLRQYCADRSIVVTAYAPLGAPARGDRFKAEGSFDVIREDKVLQIAQEIQKTPGQVLLAYLIQQDLIPLPKSTNPKRIEENFKAVDVKLSPSHIDMLNTLDRGFRSYPQSWAEGHPEYVAGEEF